MERPHTRTSAFLVTMAGVLALGASAELQTSPAAKLANQAVRSTGELSEYLPADSVSLPHRDAGDLLNEFLNGEDRTPNFAADANRTKLTAPRTCAGVSTDGYSLRLVIATLPEPIAPPLRYVFDGHLDAIQRAAESAGYVLDRTYLPWPSLNATQNTERIVLQRLAPGEQPDVFRDPATMATERYMREPGVIIFGQPNPDEVSGVRKLLVLFVVGETPTEGVRKDALLNALDQVATLSRWTESAGGCLPPRMPDETRTVKILGPTFSGSISSITMAVAQWKARLHEASRGLLNPTVIMLSGSASAIDFQVARSNGIRATVVPEAVTVEAIIDFLQHKMGARSGEIASLSEANTVYGRLREPCANTHLPPDLRQWIGLSHVGATACGNRGDDQVLHLYFPLHISGLRAALAKQKNYALPDSHSAGIPIPDEEIEAAGYIIPPASPRTATYDDMVLSNVLWGLHHARIRYVIIRASDVEDIIFLAEQIRNHAPDTVLITTWADLLYLHPEVNRQLRGMLIFSTYPLFIGEQIWSDAAGAGRHSLQQFPFDVAEGEYNAALALFSDQGAA